jgi:hypothetical protein
LSELPKLTPYSFPFAYALAYWTAEIIGFTSVAGGFYYLMGYYRLGGGLIYACWRETGFSSILAGECFSITSFLALSAYLSLSASFALSCYSFALSCCSLARSCCSLRRSCCSLTFLSLSAVWANLISRSSLTFSALTSFWCMMSLSLFSCSIRCFCVGGALPSWRS